MPDHPYRILIIEGSGSGKTNTLLNLIKEQDNDLFLVVDKIYLHAEDLNELKCQLLIKKREDAGIKHLNNLNGFTEHQTQFVTIQKEAEKSNLFLMT